MDWYLICCFVILKTAVSSCYYIILSFVTSSKARKLSTIRTNTHTHTHASASFSSCSAIQGGKKTPECWRVPHVFGSYWHWGESSFQTPPPTKPSYREFPSCEWTSGDKPWPNRTDGSALFAFCCYLFMCLFFLSLSPPIQRPSILSCPSSRRPTRKQCLVTSGVICTHHILSMSVCVCFQ